MTMPPAIRCVLVAAVVALGACSAPPSPQKPVATPEPPPRDLVAEVRAAAADADDALEVQPLRDPQIEDLRASATRAESAGRHAEADAFLQEALVLTPDDPDLLQWRAELLLAQGYYDEAAILANRSYERGPKLGALCRRNWATIQLAREMREQTDDAATAAQQAMRCTVQPPVRM